MIEKLEDRGDVALIIEDGVTRIITRDEYIEKLQELDKQNTKMDSELNPSELQDQEVEETAPVAPEIAPESEETEEVEETPVEDEDASVDEELPEDAPTEEDTPEEEATEN